MKPIAIVILNWNGRDMMRRFLPSVITHSEALAEVIVADNGSTDGSCEMLAKEFPSVRQIVLPENYGFAEGYNRALAGLEADYYLLLNSDVEVKDDWLAPLYEFMEKHREVAACQPKLLAQREPDTYEYAGAMGGLVDRYGYPYCRGRIFDTVEKDLGQYDTDATPLLWATGAALMVRREDWEASGGLDGRFFAHMEEIDLCWRLCSRGRKVACVPQSRAYHVGGASLAQGNPRKTFLNFRNNLLMLYKNLPEESLRPVMRMRCLLDYVAATKFLLSGDLGNARAVLRARREFQRMKPDFLPQRTENLRLMQNPHPAGLTRLCLLWQYHARGRKLFSQLPQPATLPHEKPTAR